MRNYYAQIHDYIHRIAALLVRKDREELQAGGASVNLMEYGVLRLLKSREGQTFQEIMESTGLGRNEVTSMVRRLLKQELIQKGPASEDRRVRRLILAEAGHQVLDLLEEQEQRLLAKVLNELSYNEEKAVLKFLVKMDMAARSDEIENIRKQVSEGRKTLGDEKET